MTEENNILSEIAIADGSVFDESKEAVISGSDAANMLAAKNMQFAYGGTQMMPGDDVVFKPTVNLDMEKKEAEDLLVKQHAMAKLKKEQDEFNKKSIDEKVKKVFIESVLREQRNAWYNKYKCEMDGKTYRKMRKLVERKYGTGIYKPTQKQYDDIAYQLSLASSEEDKNKANLMLNKAGTAQNINSLMQTV